MVRLTVRLGRMHGLQSRGLLGGVDLLGNRFGGVDVVDVVAHLIDGRTAHGELLGNQAINALSVRGVLQRRCTFAVGRRWQRPFPAPRWKRNKSTSCRAARVGSSSRNGMAFAVSQAVTAPR